MPGPLKNERHERFAHEIAKGVLQKDAYAIAGFSGGEQHASRLAARPDVRARVDEILSRAAKRAEITVADIAKQLDEDRTFAKTVKQAGAMVSATLGKAKVLGLIVDRQGGPDGGPQQHIVKIDMSGLTAEQKRVLASIKLPGE